MSVHEIISDRRFVGRCRAELAEPLRQWRAAASTPQEAAASAAAVQEHVRIRAPADSLTDASMIASR